MAIGHFFVFAIESKCFVSPTTPMISVGTSSSFSYRHAFAERILSGGLVRTNSSLTTTTCRISLASCSVKKPAAFERDLHRLKIGGVSQHIPVLIPDREVELAHLQSGSACRMWTGKRKRINRAGRLNPGIARTCSRARLKNSITFGSVSYFRSGKLTRIVKGFGIESRIN